MYNLWVLESDQKTCDSVVVQRSVPDTSNSYPRRDRCTPTVGFDFPLPQVPVYLVSVSLYPHDTRLKSGS